MSDDPKGGSPRRRTLRRQRPRVIGAALCLIAHQTCEALVPVAIGVAVDTAVVGGGPVPLLLCLGGLTLLFAALSLCYRWFARLGEGAVIDESHALRSELAGHVMAAGPARRRHGELLTIASSDADQAARSVIWLSGLFGAGAALAVSCAVLLTIDLMLGAILIVTAVAVTLALNALSPLLSRRVTEQQRTLASASALATDLVTGLRVLHGLGAQRNATARYREVSRAVEVAGVRSGVAKALQQASTVLGATIVLAVSVTFAGLLALDGSIGVGAFVAAVGVAQFISEPLTSLGFFLQLGAAAEAGARRVRAVLTQEPAAQEPAAQGAAGGTPPAPGTARIDVARGEFVGIVADPEELARVVAALRFPERAGVHVEPHRPDVFAGSLAENLALGRPSPQAADADPTAAVEAAGAREFVDAQPAGLDEHVRDRGLSLSGGQRQRLVLARALHTDPEVLVLLEPTTSVDSMTEQVVADGIRALRHGPGAPVRTTVVVTSSPALLARTDRVVLVRGEAAPVLGTHHGLLAHHDDYRGRVLG